MSHTLHSDTLVIDQRKNFLYSPFSQQTIENANRYPTNYLFYGGASLPQKQYTSYPLPETPAQNSSMNYVPIPSNSYASHPSQYAQNEYQWSYSQIMKPLSYIQNTYSDNTMRNQVSTFDLQVRTPVSEGSPTSIYVNPNTTRISFYERYFQIQSYLLHYSQEDPLVSQLYHYCISNCPDIVSYVTSLVFGNDVFPCNISTMDEDVRELLFQAVCIHLKSTIYHWQLTYNSTESYWTAKNIFDHFFSPEEDFPIPMSPYDSHNIDPATAVRSFIAQCGKFIGQAKTFPPRNTFQLFSNMSILFGNLQSGGSDDSLFHQPFNGNTSKDEYYEKPPVCNPMHDNSTCYITIHQENSDSHLPYYPNNTHNHQFNIAPPPEETFPVVPSEPVPPRFWLYRMGNTEFYLTTNYEATAVLGCGTYGVVIAANDKLTGESVAIKKQHFEKFFCVRSYFKRLMREIRIMNHINHPNLMSFFDIIPPMSYRTFDSIYLVTQRMDHSLKDIMNANTDMLPEHISYIMYQMTSAIRYLHGCKIIHRDLKPENVLINADCEIRIIDFGLSKSLPPLGNPFISTEVVSLFYRAPELLLGSKVFSEATDIWSLGTIFAELFRPTREPLFQSSHAFETLQAILRLIGTPTKEELEAARHHISPNGYYMLHAQEVYSRANFKQVFPLADDDAIDLIERMLVFNPERRITAAEILNHPYLRNFRSFHNESTFPDIPFDASWEEEFDNNAVDPKQILFDYVCEYNLHHNNYLVGQSEQYLLGEKRPAEDGFHNFT